MTKSILKATTFAILCIVLTFGCKKDEYSEYQLGTIELKVTGSEDAIQHFEKGLLLLHSFEFEDARGEFLKAQESDPEMVMAYWGEAMSHNHPLWSEQDYEAGSEALNKISSEMLEKDITPVEQDLVQAITILYEPDKPKLERDKAYSVYMETLFKKYPQNLEVAAFYALSLLGSVPEGRDVEIYGQGAEIAKGILKENPKHPGALHYLIHSYDDPDHAAQALMAADNYSVVAPDAAHALHMPSHIYVALGDWDKVVESNIRSYGASVDRMKQKGLDDNARGYHSYHWLEYGYLQRKEYEKAEEMVKDMVGFVENEPSKRARVHMVFLKGTYLNETDDWDNEIADIETDVSGLNIFIRAQNYFIEGMKAYHAGNRVTLDTLISDLVKEIKSEQVQVETGPISMCAGSSREIANSQDIYSAEVIEMQLRALLARLDGNTEETEKWMKASIEKEKSLSYSYGPPDIQRPTFEFYGEWLLDQGRYEEAYQQFEFALKRGPNRTRAITGKDRASSRI